MIGELLYWVDAWVLFVLSLVLLCGSAELGFRVGRRYAAKVHPDIHGNIATVESAMLGLLGLLLGFAFAMAIGRLDTRKEVVMDEANDIQTAFLRAQLLAEPYRTECSRLLTEYLECRIRYYQAGNTAIEYQQALDNASTLHVQLWRQAVAAAQANSDEVRTGLFIESLNGVIDDHTKRMTAMQNHVPEAILHLLMLVAILTVAVTGFSFGLKQSRQYVLMILLVITLSAVLLVILDLDRPRRGLIQVSEHSLINVRNDLDRFRR